MIGHGPKEVEKKMRLWSAAFADSALALALGAD
jgi:hypothetical protein